MGEADHESKDREQLREISLGKKNKTKLDEERMMVMALLD